MTSHIDAAAAHKARRLDRIEEIRSARRLVAGGRSESDIADLLHTTQARVRRMLSASTGRLAESPEEIIPRATVDGSDRDALVRRLCECTYTFRRHAPEPFEGPPAAPGTTSSTPS